MRSKYLFLLEKKNYLFLAFVLLYFLPSFFLGEDSKILYFDNMDSNIVWQKIALSHKQLFFSPGEKVPNLLGGIPFSSIYFNFDLSTIIFASFGMYWGYVVNKILMVLVAYLGMNLLLSKNLKVKNEWIIWASSVAFALHPFWSFSAHVAGIPLVISGFWSIITGNKRWYQWAFIVLYGLYSNLLIPGLFVILILTILWLFYSFKKKKIIWSGFWALALLSSIYLLTHFPTFYSLLNVGFISHRVEMVPVNMNLLDTIRFLATIILRGDEIDQIEGASGYFYLPGILMIVLYLTLGIRKCWTILSSLFAYLVISYGVVFLINWEFTASFYQHLYKVLPVDWLRLLWIHPIIWMLIMAIILDHFMTNNKKKLFKIGSLLFLVHFALILSFHPQWTNKNSFSFNEIYSEKEFQKFSENSNIQMKDKKVLCIGFDPSVVQYNGYHTVGGFAVNYPLEYKHQFNLIIKDELEFPPMNNFYYNFFHKWGNKCYTFIRTAKKKDQNGLDYYGEDLKINFQAAKKMGADYVFSNIRIEKKGLSLVKKQPFENNHFIKTLFVYKIMY
ncbi:MAG: DUF6044 family protein [Flavobacteriales bacterium]|jgi:hypothetical protein|nr:DUF6044 family protein [Flavobacteriales bacterium]